MAHQAARAGHIIQFPERQQPSIRGDAATVELQLEAPVKIEPKNVRFRVHPLVGGAAPAAGERSEVRGHRQQIEKSAALTVGAAPPGKVYRTDAVTSSAPQTTGEIQ